MKVQPSFSSRKARKSYDRVPMMASEARCLIEGLGSQPTGERLVPCRKLRNLYAILCPHDRYPEVSMIDGPA